MIGDRLGNWVIYKELGRGGMGRVYLAREEMGGRLAAIKILAAELAQEVGFLHRFQREIEALSKLDHPRIVRFLESGVENGLYYYVMEYVEGDSLEKILEQKGRLPWKEVLDIALQVCPALKHAHDHGIVHRDIKPANLLRTPAGVVKLTDFGIAKVFAGHHLTATGGIVGTAEFISPEQAAGKPATRRSDLYSLGVVLYLLVTGRPPFEGPTPLDLLHKHRYAQFDPPARFITDLPYEFDEIICQLLEKEPDKRPPDALVLGKQLDRIRRKLEHKHKQTNPALRTGATMGDAGRSLSPAVSAEGPATMMSRLVRNELEKEKYGGPLRRFFNHPIVLLACLAAIIGVLVWTFWPPSAESLYQHAATLMQSDQWADWETARRDYLEPFVERFPDHPHRPQVDQWLKAIEVRRHERDNPTPSEAERFYYLGERALKEGNLAAAEKIWNNVVTAFTAVEAEEHWVQAAREALVQVDKLRGDAKRWETVRAALKHAAELARNGKRKDAEKIWQALEELYQFAPNDPGVRAILNEVKAARQKS